MNKYVLRPSSCIRLQHRVSREVIATDHHTYFASISLTEVHSGIKLQILML